MSTSTVLAVLLVCLTACVVVDSYSLRLLQLDCPPDADTKLDACLSTLEHFATFNLLPESCEAAMDAMRCSQTLTRACMNNDGVLKVLSSHDLFTAITRVKPICAAVL